MRAFLTVEPGLSGWAEVTAGGFADVLHPVVRRRAMEVAKIERKERMILFIRFFMA